ncbi:MAG: hypothetical protein WAT79_16385 [Saprospiraceae bacterium]
MLKTSFWLLISILSSFVLKSQSDIPIGEWRSHLGYKEGTWVAQSQQNIFYAATKGLIILDKEDGTTRFLSREDGLSDVSIDKLFFDSFNQQLIIVYTDSNIDLLLNGDEIVNISAIKDNRTVFGSKTIHHIQIINNRQAYFATDFGILSFDLVRHEFINTTFTSFSINDISYLEPNIYAASDQGIYVIDQNDVNPADFGRWIKISTEVGLPLTYQSQHIAVFEQKLYAVINNSLWYQNEDGIFIRFQEPESNFDIVFLSTGTQFLLVGHRNFDNNKSYIYYINPQKEVFKGAQECLSRLRYAVEDASGNFWFADEWSPIKYAENWQWGCLFLDYNSPLGNQSGEIHFKGEVAYIAGGGITEDYQNPSGSYGFYRYQDKNWTNYIGENLPEISQYDMAYIQTVVPHPKKNELYIGSHWNGLMKWNLETNEIEHYNKDNSNRYLLPRIGDTLRTRVPFMTFDSKDNLWICNFGSAKPLVVRTKDGVWQNYTVPGNNNLAKITIDKNQNKWITVQGVGNGLLVFNEGNDILNSSDDQSRYITSANSEIKANRVHTVFSDLNGSIWVGTSEGPVIFDCPDPFKSTCTGATRKVIEDGIPAILLKAEEILSIAADGANRKWLGTRNGIFVLSPSGDTLITKFDQNNSPLIDNTIRYLSFNGETGEMWISTNNGLQSYRTTTTFGGRTHEKVYVFPNPVRPGYEGPVAINGLVRDANVKITDISGRLVFETTADGGQAIWNAKDYTGNRVSSGVYLVFSTSTELVDSPDTLVTKILVMN